MTRRFRAFLGALFSGFLALLLLAGSATAADNAIASSTTLEVYVRDGCPHCAQAKDFLATQPGLSVAYRPVDTNPEAREALVSIARISGNWPPAVPTFVINGRVRVGFSDSPEEGDALLAWMNEAAPAARVVDTALFGTLRVEELGLPLFTLALGLLDGFNPCATWVLLFLLSLLVRLHDRRRMALIATTFVLTSGAIYYAFMAAWLNLFLAVGLSNPARWLLALLAVAIGTINVKDFFAWGKGVSLSIPDRAKPGLYARMRTIMSARHLPSALMATAALAILVNFVELLCTAGLPAIYTAVLTQHNLGLLAYHGYLGLYILGYIADDALMVGLAVTALSSRKLSENTGRWLKLLSGMVMLGLGVIMVLRPELLG